MGITMLKSQYNIAIFFILRYTVINYLFSKLQTEMSPNVNFVNKDRFQSVHFTSIVVIAAKWHWQADRQTNTRLVSNATFITSFNDKLNCLFISISV